MSFSTPYTLQRITSTVYPGNNYKKTKNIVMGSDVFLNRQEVGALLDSSGLTCIQWYRPPIVESYLSLMRLIAQQYTNVQAKAQVNFSMTVRGLFDPRLEAFTRRPHIIGTADVITVNDTTTNSWSVDGKFYMPGAVDINYTDDTLNGTVLEISNVDLASTFTDELINKP